MEDLEQELMDQLQPPEPETIYVPNPPNFFEGLDMNDLEQDLIDQSHPPIIDEFDELEHLKENPKRNY